MDSVVATAYSPHQNGGATQPASHSEAAAAGSFSHQQQQPQPAEQNHGSFSHVFVVPLHIMGTTTPYIVALSNTHQVVSLKLTTTNYLYWRMQMKSYLLGQGVFHFVNGSVPCPPSHDSDCSDGSSSAINPSFLRWKQQDQLILSALLSSLSMDVLHLVVDCQTSSCVWRTLEKALASPSNSRIMQLHGSFQDLQQGDASVTTYMQHAKPLFDELAAAGRPLSLEDFNLYIFCGLHGEFKDLVTSLVTKAKPLSYADLYSHLLTHEFLHKSSLLSLAVNPPLMPKPSLLSSAPLAQKQKASILAVIEVVPTEADAPTAIGITAMAGLIFVALIPLLPRTGSRVIGNGPDGLLLVDSGLLNDLLSSTSSVSYTSLSATQPRNVLSFF